MIGRFSLIVEVWLEGILPAVFLHYHPLVAQHGDKGNGFLVGQFDTYCGIDFD